jgi:hypothetical protein
VTVWLVPLIGKVSKVMGGSWKNRIAQTRKKSAAAEMMSNLVLTLSVRWLLAMDALAATCMNTDWNAELCSTESNVVVWKQVS